MGDPTLLTAFVLSAAVCGIVALGLLIALAVNLVWPFGLWPADTGWQRYVALGLFRAYSLGMVVTAGFALATFGLGDWPRYVIGVPIMVGAYALSLLSYRVLGRSNTYFGSDGLVTEGLYAASRNPGYVASLAAALGLAIVAGSWVVLGLFAGLFAIYFLFALNEERWLAKGYGRPFLRYMARTPRFVDARSLRHARDVLDDIRI